MYIYYLCIYIYIFVFIYLFSSLLFVLLAVTKFTKAPIKPFVKSGSKNLVRFSKQISLAHLWMARPIFYLLAYILSLWRPYLAKSSGRHRGKKEKERRV